MSIHHQAVARAENAGVLENWEGLGVLTPEPFNTTATCEATAVEDHRNSAAR